MFSALQDYAVSRGLASPPGMNTKSIFWRIDLDRDGHYLGLTPLTDTQGQLGLRFAGVPEQKANVMNAGGRSHFMVETLDVVVLLGLEKQEEKKQSAIRAKHDYFVSLLKDSAQAFAPNGLCAHVLEDEELCARIRQDLQQHKAKPTQTVAFAVDDRLLIRQTGWHAWWQQRRSEEGAPKGKTGAVSQEQRLMRCLMSGELVLPVASHDKIKGLTVIGGQALSALVSFDKDAFSSFGLGQASNAAMSETAMKAYLDAMNDLVQKGTGYSDMGLMVLTWYRDPLADPKDDAAALLDNRHDEMEDEEDEEDRRMAAMAANDPASISSAERRAKELLQAVESGKRQDLMGNRYHIIILSSAGARVMIRDYRDVAFVELTRNIDQWLEDTRLVSLYRVGGMLNPPRFKGLIASVATPFASGKLDWKSVPPNLAANLYFAALLDSEIPYAALERAVLRLRNEALSGGMLLKSKDAKVKGTNYAALQLIRAYHVRKNRNGVSDVPNPTQPGLNPDHPETAYQTGRLMAVLADLQRSALGEVGAGVIERFYGSFSTTPAMVYGRLIHLAQNHLSKLSGGGRHYYDGKLSEINAKIVDRLPTTLTMEEQSLFALGYYQQMHRLIGEAKEASVRRKAEKAAAEDVAEPSDSPNDEVRTEEGK